MSFNASGTASRANAEHWMTAQITALGEFAGFACCLLTQRHDPVSSEHIAAARISIAREDFAGSEALSGPEGEDSELGLLLGAIAVEMHQIAAAVRAGIMADFAARVVDARRCLPRHQLAGALAAIKQARGAALAIASRNAKAELQGRTKAAIAARRPSTLKRAAVFPSTKPS